MAELDTRLFTMETRMAVMENRLDTLEEEHDRSNGNLLLAVEAIRKDIKEIFEFINRSKGGITALILAASVITGTVVSVVSWVLAHFIH